MSLEQITMFSWGYWGWGNAVSELLKVTEAIEKEKGFLAPVFVDIRLRRSVRAEGFRENALGKILGEKRYYWMNQLGNLAIATGQGPMKIKDPKGAEELLEMAINLEKRRIIFFCACEYQRYGKRIGCHRYEVGKLLLKAAERRGIKLTIVEWPGGEPKVINLTVPLNQTGRIPLGMEQPSIELTSLPWTSIVNVSKYKVGSQIYDEEEWSVICGPARIHNKSWYLPALGWDQKENLQKLQEEAKKARLFSCFQSRITS